MQGENGTAESIQAGAATLVIWAENRGIVWLPDQVPQVLPDETADEEDDSDEMPF